MVFLAAVGTASAEEDFPLTGDYTQNVPCKGDGTDAVEVKVKISPQKIDSHVAVCTFLDTKREGDRGTTHQELHLSDLRRLIREAGRDPVERDTLYRQVPREPALAV